MEKEREVTISLEEYEALYRRNFRAEKDEDTITRIYNAIEDFGKTKAGYSFEPFMKGVGIKNLEAFVKEVLEIMYYADTWRYKRVYNYLEQRQAEEKSTLENNEKGE